MRHHMITPGGIHLVSEDRKIWLQQFAGEETPIEINPPILDEDENEPPAPPLPPAIVTPPANNPMPSGVSGEAWRNVEELLVTISNANRVNMEQLKSQIGGLSDETKSAMREVLSGVHNLNETMNQFKQLLETAIIEDGGTPPGQDPPKDEPKKKSKGWASRRGN